MDALPAAGIAAAAGYCAGSIPFAWLAVKVRTGRDLRAEGSGNVGATNASRVLGRPWFLLLYALDFAKGAAPLLLAPALAGRTDRAAFLWVQAAAGAGAILGHMFPAWLGFRGGKAVATGSGVLALLVPDALAAGLVAFLVVFAATRFVSLGSVAGALAAAAWLLATRRDDPGDQLLPAGLFTGLLAAAVVVRHLPNLRRIAAGTEPRAFGKRAAPAGEEPVEP